MSTLDLSEKWGAYITYHYFNNNGNVLQNRLYSVNDQVNANTYPDDIDDQGTFNNDPDHVNINNNYSYTELGELKKDAQEEIVNIAWRTDGKIKEVDRTNGSQKKNLKFDYDPMGNRIAKHVYESDGTTWDYSTYYVRDAQGNIMATYSETNDQQNATLSYKLIERYIYGSSRVGIFGDTVEMIGATLDPNIRNHYLSKREYEGVNHLGNVLTVFTDRKIPLDNNQDGTVDAYKADLLMSQDYYPGGALMPGRTFSSDNYAFGYQGSLKDDEIKGSGNSYTTEFRELDPRILQWWSLDPKSNAAESPYIPMFRNPIMFVDVRGDSGDFRNTEGKYVGNDGINDHKVYVTTDATVNQNTNECGVDWTCVKQDANTKLLAAPDPKDANLTEAQFNALAGTLFAEGSVKNMPWQEAAGIYSVLRNRGAADKLTPYQEAKRPGIFGWGRKELINSSDADPTKVQNAYRGLITGLTSDHDYSNGGYYWQGVDFHKHYDAMSAYEDYYLVGFLFTNPAHDIWNLGNHEAGSNTPYCYKFQSTNASGKTTFMKLTDEWIKEEHYNLNKFHY